MLVSPLEEFKKLGIPIEGLMTRVCGGMVGVREVCEVRRTDRVFKKVRELESPIRSCMKGNYRGGTICKLALCVFRFICRTHINDFTK